MRLGDAYRLGVAQDTALGAPDRRARQLLFTLASTSLSAIVSGSPPIGLLMLLLPP